jgi:hypothetical protein
MLLEVRQLKQKKKKDYDSRGPQGCKVDETQTNECVVFLSRCVNNEWENREHLGRLGNGVFGCLVGAQWKGRWMAVGW